MNYNYKIPDKFYLVGCFIIIGIVISLIVNTIGDNESIASSEKARILGISDTNIIMPQAILVIDNENEWHGTSTSLDINNIIKDLEIPFYPEDLVSYFPDPKLEIGTTITIRRAPVIFLNDGAEKRILRSWASNVADLFIEKNINLGILDKISIPLDSEIKSNDVITITRIGERDELVDEIVAYQRVERSTSEMYRGEMKIQQKGSNGRKIKTFRLHYENNILTSRTLVKEEIVVEVKNEIILIGTKPRITVRCRFNDIVEEASARYGIDPNSLCRTMMCESNGNPYSGYPNGPYQGLFQYIPSFWISISARAGFAGASITDARAQIYVTCWAWSHGYRGRWPNC